MKIRRPSPAMAVACTALFIALGGTSIAAVNYARNAGAVDGKSAVSAGASLARAKGNLVATARGGSNAGRIPGKFLADVTRGESFARAFDVTDNTPGAALELAGAAPHEALHAGDSVEHDVAGALAMGMEAVLVDRDGSARAVPSRVTVVRALPWPVPWGRQR